jgi:hypothetical protein
MQAGKDQNQWKHQGRERPRLAKAGEGNNRQAAIAYMSWGSGRIQ